ncbi:protein kinase PINOID-like [Panicum virgatum]|uniref:protein kinase PINOID-like n=1 Tax=Panicum virgatum TaxID=38727 RepID=UPI0019D552DD|nr:protein kinase PINOID-like [Panicum virgatum]
MAPEVARGGPHGAVVDWWALGVFLYELLHGRTLFAGADNGPRSAKDPARRLGSRRGAADVKAHPFFRGLNFVLLRSSRPPFVPGASPLHRSQSCHAAPVTATPKTKKPPAPAPDPRFDLS